MAEELTKNNLFFDYLYNLRLVDPELSAETNDLKEKSAEYTDSEWINVNYTIFNWRSTIHDITPEHISLSWQSYKNSVR